jgi:hypothetical protein
MENRPNRKSRVTSRNRGPRSASLRRLSEIRDALLHLHKTLVDSERVSYEQTVGAIQSPNHFLQLLTSDPWFAWLHPLSQFIVSLDEALEEKEPLTEEVAVAMIRQSSVLLLPSETGEGFSGHYFNSLQTDPDVVFAHAAAMKLIGRG